MEIPAASIGQIQRLRDGRMVFLEDDVCGVVKQLQEIDPALRVCWSEGAQRFAVYQILSDGTEHLVTTTPALDGRLVKRIQEIAAPGYDYAAELDRLDREADREKDRALRDRLGEIAERFGWAVRKDLKEAKPGNVYVPPDVY